MTDIDFEDALDPVPEGWQTFGEWSASGYTIRAGMKAHWCNGVAYFTPSQVSKNRPTSYPGGFYDECPSDFPYGQEPYGYGEVLGFGMFDTF